MRSDQIHIPEEEKPLGILNHADEVQTAVLR